MFNLANTADRQPLASEPSLRFAGVRQLPFGLGNRPTHRVLFGIEDDRVVVYRVRAFAQDKLMPDELTGE
jgi:hypothetical protein